jgi:Zn-dependent protease
MENIAESIVSIIIVLISLTFHEAAHALVAYLFGDSTARDQGRLSLNPIAHIDLFGTILLPIVLALSGAGVFGWAKPVPVNVNNLRNPKRDDGYIGAAGPMTNFALAIIAAIFIRLLIAVMPQSLGSPGTQYLLMILVLFIQINVLLMIFNLIPIPPLDGSAILEAVLPMRYAWKFHQLHRYGFLILIVLIFTNILDAIYFKPVGGIIMAFIKKIAGI